MDELPMETIRKSIANMTFPIDDEKTRKVLQGVQERTQARLKEIRDKEYGKETCSMWYFKCKNDCPYRNDKTYCYLHLNNEMS